MTNSHVAEALERIGENLRVDAFNGVTSGKPDFTAMIVRDDEPGVASILAQQMQDQVADDILTVVEFARAALSLLRQPEQGREGEIEYEVWQADAFSDGDAMVAGSSSLSEASHYAAVYSQDGPAWVVEVTRRKLPSAPVDGDRA